MTTISTAFAVSAPFQTRRCSPFLSCQIIPRRTQFRSRNGTSWRSTLHSADVNSDVRILPNQSSSQSAAVSSVCNSILSQPKPRSVRSRLLELALAEWKTLLPALFSALLTASSAALQPVCFGRIISVVAQGSQTPGPAVRALLMTRVLQAFIVQLFEVIFSLAFVQLASRAAESIIRRLRRQVFSTALSNDLSFFDVTGRPEVEKGVSSDLRILRSLIWSNLGRDRGIRSILEATVGLVVCIRLTGFLGLAIFGLMLPILSLIVVKFGKRTGLLMASDEGQEVTLQSYISERIRGLRTIKAFGAERREAAGLESLLQNSKKSIRKLARTRALSDATARGSIFLTGMVLYSVCGGLVCMGKLSFESFSSLIGFIYVLNFAVQGTSYTLQDLARGNVVLKSVFSVLDQAEQARQSREAGLIGKERVLSADQLHGEVQFHNVSFHYPSRPDTKVLKGVSFSVKPGEMVALVGESGGGKSTIGAILSRFYVATEGAVTIDGYDIKNIVPEVYSKILSVVDQEPFLFTGPIRDNLAYGIADAEVEVDESMIEEASREANAHGFVSELKEGYGTVWSPGSNLSGGQRQRLAIARSLLKRPKVLVLDEATSALDQESELAVQAALERMMEGRTTLVIAHRLSTVRKADKILFVRNGEIIESGTYEELYARDGGSFRALVDSADGLVEDGEDQ